MWKFARPLRLLIILLAILIIIFMHWRSHTVALFWREATYRTWAQKIEFYEMKLRVMMEHRLDEPFSRRDGKIDEFVKPVMDVQGFVNWLHKEASGDSLIGAGIVWRRNEDTLMVVPLSLQVHESVLQELHRYMDVSFAPENYPNMPDSVGSYLDSLKKDINKEVGFSSYVYKYFLDYKNYPKRQQQAEARKVAFVILWNHDYYRRTVLPGITELIMKDPKSYSLFVSDYPERDYCNGILLTDASNDTIFHLGQVQMEPDSLFLRYALWFEFSHKPLDRSPGWQLHVQDHWKNEDPMFEGMSLFMPNLRKHGTPTDSRDALMMIKGYLSVPMLISDRPPMLLITLALSILFLMIMIQIIARNRQRDFIAHVSHELRTPVAKVKLFAETLRQDRAISEAKEDEYLDTILRESDHLSVLIDNTLNLARLDAGKLKIIKQTIDLSDWITKLIEKHRPGLVASGFEMQLNIEPDLPSLKSDPEALELALNNLIDNAVKYSTEHKEIQILVMKKGKTKVQISVSDQGVGIPAGKRKAIFKRFYRIKPKDREPIAGAGVGLSLVKEIMKRHSGKVWCEARDGGGSTFIMELPVKK